MSATEAAPKGAVRVAMHRYGRVFARPRVRSLLLASAVARLSMTLGSLAVLLFLRSCGLSFAQAGLVSGAFVLALGLGAPMQARLMARLGARRVLNAAGAIQAAALVALIFAARMGSPVVVLTVFGACAGGTVPPVSSAMRRLWPVLLGTEHHLLSTAFAVDSLVTEATFFVGPLVVAICTATGVAELAVVASGAAALGGTLWFTALWPPDGESSVGGTAAGTTGPPAAAFPFAPPPLPAVRTVLIGALPMGMVFGTIEVALAAFGRSIGDPGAGGLALAGLSVGSAIGGIAYGARAHKSSPQFRYLLLLPAIPLALVLLALGSSLPAMLLLTLPAGMTSAPFMVVEAELIHAVAPPRLQTEAYAWLTLCVVVGVALGNVVGGATVDGAGWRVAIIGCCVLAVIVDLVVFARRRSLG